MSWKSDFENERIDRRDPNPWLALYLDRSLPIHEPAKKALLAGNNTWSRRLLLPVVRPLARLSIVLVQLLRIVIPERWNSSRLLHKTIYWGLKYFVRGDANYLILRHFNIGTELLQFIADNIDGVRISSTKPLRPKNLCDLLDDTFLIHDLNIYNFIAELNEQLRRDGRDIRAAERLDFSAITDGEFDLQPGGDHATNVLDLQTAIEMYTPLYALFLSDHDFWRASNSLQLDETISIYIGKLLNDSMALSLVSNRHPMVPHSTLQAGFRLMLHGLDAELLHGYLRSLKQANQKNTNLAVNSTASA
ncbi:hypothetical protein Mag101_02220 [Microbulbifer agarilyticus]|uniref:Uncharacterized protein n=1 Tax=Microbulbifer agarilyticus TaxID=260552 RepID=A0A1Q2M2Y4_9GAMM|nr:hypothetical protein [Microbulbifer agarilyticus]AQQ66592.1 hypothetical protein Mag101_02220 [Microbulbifer agarilyticus]